MTHTFRLSLVLAATVAAWPALRAEPTARQAAPPWRTAVKRR
jgi:hypothetical protein